MEGGSASGRMEKLTVSSQVFGEVKRNISEGWTPNVDPDTVGYVNQHGLSRKVGSSRESAGVTY